MSAVVGRVSAVSSAITNRPACLAWLELALTALPLVVIRMPLSPREIALSIAVIWVWVSPSGLPAATRQVDIVLARRGLSVLLHRHEVRVGQGLQNQRDTDLLPAPSPAAGGTAATAATRIRRRRTRRKGERGRGDSRGHAAQLDQSGASPSPIGAAHLVHAVASSLLGPRPESGRHWTTLSKEL